jgi:hypothetical protein
VLFSSCDASNHEVILFEYSEKGGQDVDLYTARPDGTELTLLMRISGKDDEGLFSKYWVSPNLKYVAWRRVNGFDPLSSTLTIRDVKKNTGRKFRGGYIDAWSLTDPDQILLTINAYELSVLKLDIDKIEKVADFSKYSSSSPPTWSPDRKTVIFSYIPDMKDPPEVAIAKMVGTDWKITTLKVGSLGLSGTKIPGAVYLNPFCSSAWSPDSRYVAFVVGSEYPCAGYTDIYGVSTEIALVDTYNSTVQWITNISQKRSDESNISDLFVATSYSLTWASAKEIVVSYKRQALRFPTNAIVASSQGVGLFNTDKGDIEYLQKDPDLGDTAWSLDENRVVWVLQKAIIVGDRKNDAKLVTALRTLSSMCGVTSSPSHKYVAYYSSIQNSSGDTCGFIVSPDIFVYKLSDSSYINLTQGLKGEKKFVGWIALP